MSQILLVDDNVDHVQLALRALRKEGTWQVDTARTGREALDKAHDRAYDLVLLDYRLPDVTGIDVLRELHKTRDVPVLLMTSQGSEEVAIAALDAGAVGYLVKNHDFGRRLAFEVRERLGGE